MSGVKEFTLWCDFIDDAGGECAANVRGTGIATLTELRLEAGRAGWSCARSGGIDYCKNHATKQQREDDRGVHE